MHYKELYESDNNQDLLNFYEKQCYEIYML